MLLLADILIMILLLVIFVQDIKSRSVYWIVFPLLVLVFIFWHSVRNYSLTAAIFNVLFNLGFLLFQLLALTAWFSVKNKRLINIIDDLLGLGDTLFLASLAFFFPFLNFLVFYIISLVLILLVWVTGRRALFKSSPYIPLAGLQALLLLTVFAFSWLIHGADPDPDNWMLHIISG
jgi:hypothetical protein